jgi:hypothetical protein
MQVLDLTAETYLEDGAIIDLDGVDELQLAAYQPQRRRRKRQRLQEQVRKLIIWQSQALRACAVHAEGVVSYQSRFWCSRSDRQLLCPICRR